MMMKPLKSNLISLNLKRFSLIKHLYTSISSSFHQVNMSKLDSVKFIHSANIAKSFSSIDNNFDKTNKTRNNVGLAQQTKNTEKEEYLVSFTNEYQKTLAKVKENPSKELMFSLLELSAGLEGLKNSNEVVETNATTTTTISEGLEKAYEYFLSNLASLDNLELGRFLESFSISRLTLKNKDDFHKIYDSIFSREYDQNVFIYILGFLLNVMPRDIDVLKVYNLAMKDISKLHGDFTQDEKINLLAHMINSNITLSDEYWENIMELVNIDFRHCGDLALHSIISLYYYIKSNQVSKGISFCAKFKEYALNNIHDFSLFILPYLFELLVFTEEADLDFLVKSCIIIGSVYKILPTDIKINFVCALHEACFLHPKFIINLKANKHLLSLFHIPREDDIKIYNEKREKLPLTGDFKKDLHLKKGVAISMLDRLGFNKYFYEQYDPNGAFAEKERLVFMNKFGKTVAKKAEK